MNKKPFIFVHADDYGMTPQSSKRIVDCFEHGCLNRMSVMPNGCYKNKKKRPEGIDCVIHINLVEGKCLSAPQRVNLLVDNRGYFNHSFLSLLLLSLSPKRKQLMQQVEREMEAQIISAMKWYEEGEPVALDSHQHTHMIPLIFRTLLRLIKKHQWNVGYMRIPAEPILPFLLEPSLYPTYAPINIIKNLLLNFLWLFDRKGWEESEISSALFCGILFSGNMDETRVCKVFPHFVRIAEKRNCDLEFLFHPGGIREGEPFMDRQKESFCQFYRSKGRVAEYETLHSEKWASLVRRYGRTKN